VKKDLYCSKILAQVIAEEPDKKPKQVLKALRKKQDNGMKINVLNESAKK